MIGQRPEVQDKLFYSFSGYEAESLGPGVEDARGTPAILLHLQAPQFAPGWRSTEAL